MSADREQLVAEYKQLREQLARVERLLQAPADIDDVKDDELFAKNRRSRRSQTTMQPTAAMTTRKG